MITMLFSAALTAVAAIVAWSCGQTLWLLDHRGESKGRRQASASMRIGLGGLAATSLMLAAFYLRAVMLPARTPSWPWWVSMISDTRAALCIAALWVMMFVSVLLITRGVRALLFRGEPGEYRGLGPGRAMP
jgi:hypothetical protein